MAGNSRETIIHGCLTVAFPKSLEGVQWLSDVVRSIGGAIWPRQTSVVPLLLICSLNKKLFRRSSRNLCLGRCSFFP